jgi:formylglycine-generating enzyme
MKTTINLLIVFGFTVSYLSCRQDSKTIQFTSGITVYSGADKPIDTTLSVAKQLSVNIPIPAGMVLVPGGFTQIGAEDGKDAEKPVFWAKIKPFFIDEHLVTVAEFRQFINATNYKTQAETIGDGGVLDERTKKWTWVKGANWQYPHGPTNEKAPDNHPVTQVSWNDAKAYAVWAKKRLPYEFEWEHAARNGTNSRDIYPFGNELITATGKVLANTWNGTFPQQDAVTDGFHYTSPVGFYGKSPLGLSDMTGNVWEWCEDWRQSYSDVVAGQKSENPTEKVERGGSHLCEPGWCHGYRVSGRAFTTPKTSLMHVGFRCVKDYM